MPGHRETTSPFAVVGCTGRVQGCCAHVARVRGSCRGRGRPQAACGGWKYGIRTGVASRSSGRTRFAVPVGSLEWFVRCLVLVIACAIVVASGQEERHEERNEESSQARGAGRPGCRADGGWRASSFSCPCWHPALCNWRYECKQRRVATRHAGYREA